jgi:methylenetetrahydrofolate dehydrogenase (NADP+)/methenyltetrahydrofolate cyclohydrolase
MIIDGPQIAKEILNSTRMEVEKLGREVVIRAVTLQPNAATHSYLKIKGSRAEDAGMKMEIVQMPDNAQSEDLITAIETPGADAVIVQLPLPDSISTSLVLDEIPLEKDADVLSNRAYERFVYNEEGALLPPVAAAVKEILERSGIEVAGKRVVIVGAGRLVGQPVSAWLEREGADVSVVTLETGDHELLPHADIIVSGAGSPHFIKPEQVKEGVVLIDAGTSESGGAIVGDIDPACAEKASVYTPVPGGVGPIAVACLFRNVAMLAQKGG